MEAGKKHFLLLDDTDKLWSAGLNDCGQLGIGSHKTQKNFVPVSNLNNTVVSIACGPYSSFAVQADGTLWGWGSNSKYNLGKGDRSSRVIPVKINLEAVIDSVSAGEHSTLALDSYGGVWSWGMNTTQQLARETVGVLPGIIPSLSGIQSIVCSNSSSFAIDSSGALWGWGSNTGNSLDLDADESEYFPQPRIISTSLGLPPLKQISSGLGICLAVDDEDCVWTWGESISEYDHHDSDKSKPIVTKLEIDGHAKRVIAKEKILTILTNEGSVYCWGASCGSTQLLVQDHMYRVQNPVKVNLPRKFQHVALSSMGAIIGVDENGKLINWGRELDNNYPYDSEDLTISLDWPHSVRLPKQSNIKSGATLIA